MGEDEFVDTEQELVDGRDNLCGGKPPMSGRIVNKVKDAIISVSTGRELIRSNTENEELELKYQTTASTKETLTNRHINGIFSSQSAV